MLQDGRLDLCRHPVRVRSARTGQSVDQPLGAVGLEVTTDLVKLLARVPHYLAGAAHVVQLLGELQQRQLASCYLVLRGHVLSPGQGGMKGDNSILHTPQGRHDHASQPGQLSGEYRLRTPFSRGRLKPIQRLRPIPSGFVHITVPSPQLVLGYGVSPSGLSFDLLFPFPEILAGLKKPAREAGASSLLLPPSGGG